MSDLALYKPNEFIGALDQLEVSRTAKHLLNYLYQYAQREIKCNGHTSPLFEVNFNLINGLADIHNHDYERIKKSLITLMQPVILRDDPKRFIAITPIADVDIDVANGLYKFALTPRVFGLLKNCDYYTKLQLAEFNPLESKHSIVLFEWLKRYEHATKIPLLSIEDLRKITGTADKKAYDNFANLKLRVLDVAVKEITDQTCYMVSYTTIQERIRFRPKVTAVQFEIRNRSVPTQPQPRPVPPTPLDLALREPLDIDTTYSDLCKLYVDAGMGTAEQFFRATYYADFGKLLWLYNDLRYADRQAPKTLADLQDKIARAPGVGFAKQTQGALLRLMTRLRDHPGTGRYQNQIEFFDTIFEHFPKDQQVLLRDAQSRMGFCSLLKRMQRVYEEPTYIGNKWL